MIQRTDAVLELRDVSYRYDRYGPSALDGISFKVGRGVVLGIVGPNGSGKTTLFRLILGFMAPRQGQVTIGGGPARAFRTKRGIGYVPEQVRLPPAVRVRKLARLAGSLAGLSKAEFSEASERLLTELGLEAKVDASVGTLSHGYRQRVGLLIALLGDPELLMLDEPANGLDPESNGMLRSVLRRLKRQGRTLIISSHNLLELERVYDEVLVLSGGRRLGSISKAELTRKSDVWVVQLRSAALRAAELAGLCGELDGVLLAVDEAAFTDKDRAHSFADRIAAAGGSVESIEPRPFDLEYLFHSLMDWKRAEDE